MEQQERQQLGLPPRWLLEASSNVDVRGCLANEIIPGLWLGRGDFAVLLVAGGGNPAGITHVLTVAADTPDVTAVFESEAEEGTAGIEYLCLDIADFGSDPGISRKFEEGFAFMDRALAAGKLFVHCANGSNRSPTFVLAYLMKTRSISLREAFELVLARRPHIQPLKDNILELLRLERRLTAAAAGGDTSVQSTSSELSGAENVAALYAESSLKNQEAFFSMKKKALRQFKKSMGKWPNAAASKAVEPQEEHGSSNTANEPITSGSVAENEPSGSGAAKGTALEAIATGAGSVKDCSGGTEYESFMTEAIAESEAAVQDGNHPFGAVLVVDGAVVLRGRNAVVTECDATRHAELVLASKASRQFSRKVLASSTLVTSTAPCPMCAGAIYWAGIGKVVFGCPAEVLGAISGEELDVDCRDVLSSGILHSVDVVGPVCGEKAAAQHRVFWPKFIAQGHSVV